eukprot:1159253-Pelagomonas_calceolata.AAC.1
MGVTQSRQQTYHGLVLKGQHAAVGMAFHPNEYMQKAYQIKCTRCTWCLGHESSQKKCFIQAREPPRHNKTLTTT